MALYVENRNIPTIYKGHRHIAAIYEGTKLIWQYIRSCYGRGYWINDKPWSDTDGWKN